MRSQALFLQIILILILLSQPAVVKGSAIARASGKPVLGLEIEGAHVSSAELRDLIPFSSGSNLSPSLVRKSVINFYRTGLYEKVEVLVKESSKGVWVKYVLYPKKWLDKIRFAGNLFLDERELLSKVDLRRSEEITDEKMVQNVDRLLAYYKLRGFSGSEITYHIGADAGERTVVVFSIKEGEKQFISDVRLSGDPGISRTKLLSIISSMPGTGLDGEDLDSDLRRVRNHLRKAMYLTPDLSYRVEPDRTFTDAVRVTFQIEKGPAFTLRVLMDDKGESEKILKEMRSVFLSSATPEKAKLSIKKYALDRYRNEGHPFVTVNLEEQGEGTDVRVINLNIDRGLKALIGELHVEGVSFFNKETIAEKIGIVPGEPFVKEAMEKGIEDLRQSYRREGFLSAEIRRHPLNFIPREDHHEVDISLVVREGPRNIVGSLSIAGGPIQEERAAKLIGVGVGDPYVPELINEGRDELLRQLGGMGYLYASVTVEEPVVRPDDTVELVVTVREGPRVSLGAVIIRGNESVDTKIIRLALDLKKGDILTRQKILKAQERIYDLKVMSSVDVQLADPETPDINKDLIVQVRERAKYVVGFRMGYGSEDRLRGEFSLTNRNIGKMARSLSLRGKASSIERSTTLLYSHPWFYSLPIDMSLSLSDLYEKRESYSRDSLSAAVDFVTALSETTETRFGYFYEGLRLSDVAPDAQLSPDDEGKTDVAALVAEILHDTRDDFLDPWTGLLGDIIVEVAARDLGSKAEYIKTELAVRRYLNIVDNMVVAALLRLGRVTAYGISEEVIISKRFFLGGQNSVRGYRLDSLGPRDASNDPVGGNYMVNANLELRYPLYRTVRGVLFLDSGSIWLENAADPADEEFKLRISSGAGLRWSSPIGPLSLDYGYKLNPAEEDEDDRYRWHFSIGHAF